jgi:hypothetical protein
MVDHRQCKSFQANLTLLGVLFYPFLVPFLVVQTNERKLLLVELADGRRAESRKHCCLCSRGTEPRELPHKKKPISNKDFLLSEGSTWHVYLYCIVAVCLFMYPREVGHVYIQRVGLMGNGGMAACDVRHILLRGVCRVFFLLMSLFLRHAKAPSQQTYHP